MSMRTEYLRSLPKSPMSLLPSSRGFDGAACSTPATLLRMRLRPEEASCWT